MKKMKRISAITGVIILVGLYLLTFISALFTTPATAGLFKVSVFCTVFIPLMLYAYLLVYRLLKNKGKE